MARSYGARGQGLPPSSNWQGIVMTKTVKPIMAADAPPRTKRSVYPKPFASRMAGRTKRPLGDLFGLANFGVNLTTLAPGGTSALHHRHARQDELVYIVAGTPTLRLDDEEYRLAPGMVIGFPSAGPAHHLRNDTDADVTFLEIGDRTPGDSATYPDDDLVAEQTESGWAFKHKDGTPY